MANSIIVTKDIEKRELTLERVVHGPIGLVWSGWTQPQHITHWWAPKGWATSVVKMDVREGGQWHYRMKQIDSDQEVWGLAIYLEIVEPSHLKYTEITSNEAGESIEDKQHTVTVGFSEVSTNTTKLTIRTQFKSIEDLEEAEQRGMSTGYNSALDKLENLITNKKGYTDGTDAKNE
jgi:uncharacterized protein YndB with AHSA1/START domain